MDRARFVMGIYAIAAIVAMMSIGYAVAIRSGLSIVAGILATIFIMGMGFKMKSKLRKQGLL